MIDLISNIPPNASPMDYAFGAVAFHRSFTDVAVALSAEARHDPEAALAVMLEELGHEESLSNIIAHRAIVSLYGGCGVDEYEAAMLGYAQEAKDSFVLKLQELNELQGLPSVSSSSGQRL